MYGLQILDSWLYDDEKALLSMWTPWMCSPS